MDIGHAVVGEDVEMDDRRRTTDDGPMCEAVKMADVGVVPADLVCDSGMPRPHLVHEAIEFREVEEGKADLALGKGLGRLVNLRRIRLSPVRDVIRDPTILQQVKDAPSAIQAAGLEQVSLLAVIEEINMSEWNVVELEVSGIAQPSLDQFGELPTDSTPISEKRCQQGERSEPPEG